MALLLAAPLLALSRAAGDAPQAVEIPLPYSRLPYLQMLQSRSVIIQWRTAVPTGGRVEIGMLEPGERVIASQFAGMEHAVAVDGLLPGTRYRYRVVASAPPGPVETASETFSFRTIPEDALTPVRIGVIGDAGENTCEQWEVGRLLTEMDPHLLIVTGDLVYPFGITEIYQRNFFNVYSRLLAGTCVYPAIGNHDFEPEFSKQFTLPDVSPDDFEAYYSIDFGPVHFTALDTNRVFTAESPQVLWLKEDLARSSRPWKIVAFHHPLYTIGPHAIDFNKDSQRSILAPILEEGGADLVLNGHDHLYERTFPIRSAAVRDAWQGDVLSSPIGLTHVVTGGGGAYLYSELPNAADAAFIRSFAAAHHALEMTITAAELSVRALAIDGAVIDAFTIRKDRPRPEFKFVRGDTDLDRELTIADPIKVLSHLFLGGSMECPATADWNGTGIVSITEAIAPLEFLFLGGPPPPPPFPNCGPVPSPRPDPADDAWCFETPCWK